MSTCADLLARLRVGVATDSADETRGLATALAANLPPDTTLALHGDMGVGKTTFVQGLAHGLKVQEQVTSPTFAIYSVYRGDGRTLLHLDAYRLENERQIEALLLEEFLVSPWIMAVEWPEKIAPWLPANTWHLTLSILEGDRHHVRLHT
jgi:tRNA threonylcarbamoyladenosine biosynthesis protein TsaE